MDEAFLILHIVRGALLIPFLKPKSPSWAPWRSAILACGAGGVACAFTSVACYKWFDHRVAGDVAFFLALLLFFAYLFGGLVFSAFHTRG